MKRWMASMAAAIFVAGFSFGCAGGGTGGGGGGGEGATGGGGGGGGVGAGLTGSYVLFGYNDLGMHCMNQDFSEIMILPPYNNLHAQLIRRGGEPNIVGTAGNGVSITYSVPNNTTSVTKTNFWTYVPDLFGVVLAPDVGLTGNGLAGSMVPTGTNDWAATGIPLTPMTDSNTIDPYQLANLTALVNGQTVAETQEVVPVSWEISCNLCHNTPGISVATDILRKHDALHGTSLESQKPVMCSQCHAQAPLGTTGSPSLSRAMHSSHASRVSVLGMDTPCYACHPGPKTKCLRDVHFSAGMSCEDCHGDMAAVASASRRPWVDEPRCGDCHSRSGFQFEQAGTLYRNSKGHHGVHCEACHGSPHAIGPSVVAADNVQAINLQGHAGTINTCAVCHGGSSPDDGFSHTLSGGD